MNTKKTLLAISLLLLIGVTGVYAAKPTPKKPVSSQSMTHIVIGTMQLDGEHGRFGETYTIGKRNPWNITVNSAEYSVGHLRVNDRIYTPNADQKMLVIHYTVHNPQKNDANMRYDFLPWTGIDAKNTNWEYIRALGAKGSEESVGMMMKPAQKMDVYTAIMVPAIGPIPKVMVRGGGEDLVLRYYPNEIVNGKNISPVTGLSAPFADPSDPTGMTALSKVKGTVGEYYPLEDFDIKLDKYSFTNAKIDNKTPKNGNKYFVLNLTVKNAQPKPYKLRFDWFVPKLTDGDGMSVKWNSNMLGGSRDVRVDTDMEPGQEIGIRYYFEVPSDLAVKSFSICQRKSRTYEYDVSDAK